MTSRQTFRSSPPLRPCPQSSNLLWNLCQSGTHPDSSQGSQQLERDIRGARGQADRPKAAFSCMGQYHDGGSVLQACLPHTRSAGDIDVCSHRWAATSKTRVRLWPCSGSFRACFLQAPFAGTNSKRWPFSFHETWTEGVGRVMLTDREMALEKDASSV